MAQKLSKIGHKSVEKTRKNVRNGKKTSKIDPKNVNNSRKKNVRNGRKKRPKYVPKTSKIAEKNVRNSRKNFRNRSQKRQK